MFKKILRSKTMVFSLLLAVFGVLQSMSAEVAQIAGEYLATATVLIGVLVAVLRVLTTTSLKDK